MEKILKKNFRIFEIKTNELTTNHENLQGSVETQFDEIQDNFNITGEQFQLLMEEIGKKKIFVDQKEFETVENKIQLLKEELKLKQAMTFQPLVDATLKTQVTLPKPDLPVALEMKTLLHLQLVKNTIRY